MAFFQVDVELMNTILIALGIALVVGVLVIVAYKMYRANANAKRAKQQEKTEQEQQQSTQSGEQSVEVRNECLVLSRNVTYKVGIDGEIAMGKYVLQSAVSGATEFNIRINGLVERYNDGDFVTFGAGDTVCAVSSSVLLKPASTDEK